MASRAARRKEQPQVEFLTVKEAAELARRSVRSVWRWIEKGQLPISRTEAGYVLIKRADLMKFLGLKEGE